MNGGPGRQFQACVGIQRRTLRAVPLLLQQAGRTAGGRAGAKDVGGRRAQQGDGHWETGLQQ